MSAKNRNLLIVTIIVVILICVGYSRMVYAPLHKDIVSDRATVQNLQRKLSGVQERAKQLTRIQTEMSSLQIEVAELEKQLPKSRELPALIRLFTRRAETFGISVLTFAPGHPAPKSGYDEVPYSVTASASFHALGRFLTSLGKGDRLFAARNIALTGSNNKTDPAKTVNVTFPLIAFKFHE